MAAAKPKVSPVGFREVLNLTQLGIQADSIKFKNVTLQSNKYICVREEGKNSLAIIDTASKNVLRLPVAVDSAIMNPITKVVALRAGSNLQIYNLEMKSKMKTATLENVVFWKWLDPKTVAVVTDTSVFHWSMDGSAEPQLMFERVPSQSQVQIISYSASADNKWLLLGGITTSSTGQGVAGVLQVYSVDLKASQQPMDSPAACFASVTVDGRDSPSNLFCFTRKTDAGTDLSILEVGVPKEQAFKISTHMAFQGQDFPVAMLPDNKHGVIFVVSKAGMLFMYEIQSGKQIFGQQASKVTMFANCLHEESGIVSIDQNGRMSHFFVDDKNIVTYICSALNDYDLGVQMAKRYNLPGAENIFKEQFSRLIQQGKIPEAMELAAASPQNTLRTLETINYFKQLPTQPGQTSPLLQYFSMLLKRGKLNQVESIELARPVLAKGLPAGLKHIEDWLKEDKLECSEDLGDLLKGANINLALSVYYRAKIPEKVIGCFLALGAKEADDATANEHFSKIFRYAKQQNFQPDYPLLVQQLIRVNPIRAKDFGLLLIRNEEGPIIDIDTLVSTFLSANDVKNTTNILLEYLRNRGDREEDAALQTKLLEINLMAMPQVADAIMESDEYKFTHYDRRKIAQLCERAQLYQRALEHYTDLEDIKRVLSNSATVLNAEFLLEYFGRMTPANCLECLHDLLKYNLQTNIRLVVEVAKKWSDYLTAQKLIELFEQFNSYNGLYFYLGSFVNFTEDKSVVFKYIKAAVKLQQLKELERVCRDNDHYEPKEVKDFLLEQNLRDPRPLIHVCDRYDFVDELTHHLYSNHPFAFIEAYVQRMNSKATPAVVGALLDMNAPEEQVQTLVLNIRPPIDDPAFIQRLVDSVEKRNRLKILQSYLEARAAEGNTDVYLHNGLGKIYVETNNNPQQFLTTNRFYDSLVVGKFCESRDPHLAFIAYKRAWGTCDNELIEVSNKNGFFKDQARYLVERQDLELWAKVLAPENEFRRQLIDQVVATALPEAVSSTTAADEVSSTVKAFMAANLPNELIELLERIILHTDSKNKALQQNKNLQNLLILTAIKADKKRVMDYCNRLENYDGPDIARIAVSDQYELYEEAFFIYKKFKKGAEAITVLLENIKSIERATEFAEYWDQPEVWSILARAQLDHNLVKEAIGSYLKAQDPSNYDMVIQSAKRSANFSELIEFLKMARAKNVKEPVIDNELIYAFAKTKRLADLEEFITGPNVAKIEQVGDLCFQEELYEAARILFTHINNNAKLALALVKLGLFADAVDAARKANTIPTWKAVCFACVDAKQFRLAQVCALNIIVYHDHLLECVRYYETRGHFEEIIHVLEQGINLDRAHQGIYTQLGILYCKYKEEKLMEHIKLFWSRLNITTLLAACKDNQHWPEAVFLYSHYDQFDNAVDCMIQHSTECWQHPLFKDIVSKVSNSEIYYRAIDFYLREHPMLLNDLLLDLSGKLDHTRVVNTIRQAKHLPLIQKYLLHVQHENLSAVNEAVNHLFLLEEDYRAIRTSIENYDHFDQIAFAQRIEGHELLEFRRIAASLYKTNKRFEKSIELSKSDELWTDAMETAASSLDEALAEALLRFFVDRGQRECYAACLFICYELIHPDVVLELSWRCNLMNFAMPFMVQCLRDYDEKVRLISHKLDEQARKAAEEEEKKKKHVEEQQDHGLVNPGFIGLPGGGPQLLMPPPGMMGPVHMFGAPPPAMGGFPPAPGGYPTPGAGYPGHF